MTDNPTKTTSSGDSSFDRALDQGLSNRLTLIVGPPTSACCEELEEWLANLEYQALRIQCPSADDDVACPDHLFKAFAAAGIIAAGPDENEAEESCRAKLVRLMNGLAALSGDLVVVLLDYQPSEATDRVVSFMLEHLPQQVHLYLVSEAIPGFSCIPRLRVRRQLQMIHPKPS